MWNGPPILSEINDPAQLRAADFVLDYRPANIPTPWPPWCASWKRVKAAAPIVALTSADNGESRSAIAVSLARAAARMGKKAIIVDCAPGHMASRAMKTRIRSGLYEVLTGSVPLNQALAKDPARRCQSSGHRQARPQQPDHVQLGAHGQTGAGACAAARTSW